MKIEVLWLAGRGNVFGGSQLWLALFSYLTGEAGHGRGMIRRD